eukprot:ANDGO_05680.mRNA.1 hypothetical protein
MAEEETTDKKRLIPKIKQTPSDQIRSFLLAFALLQACFITVFSWSSAICSCSPTFEFMWMVTTQSSNPQPLNPDAVPYHLIPDDYVAFMRAFIGNATIGASDNASRVMKAAAYASLFEFSVVSCSKPSLTDPDCSLVISMPLDRAASLLCNNGYEHCGAWKSFATVSSTAWLALVFGANGINLVVIGMWLIYCYYCRQLYFADQANHDVLFGFMKKIRKSLILLAFLVVLGSVFTVGTLLYWVLSSEFDSLCPPRLVNGFLVGFQEGWAVPVASTGAGVQLIFFVFLCVSIRFMSVRMQQFEETEYCADVETNRVRMTERDAQRSELAKRECEETRVPGAMTSMFLGFPIFRKPMDPLPPPPGRVARRSNGDVFGSDAAGRTYDAKPSAPTVAPVVANRYEEDASMAASSRASTWSSSRPDAAAFSRMTPSSCLQPLNVNPEAHYVYPRRNQTPHRSVGIQPPVVADKTPRGVQQI